MIPAVLSNIRNETETMWDIFYSAPETKRLPHLLSNEIQTTKRFPILDKTLLGRSRPLDVLLAHLQLLGSFNQYKALAIIDSIGLFRDCEIFADQNLQL